jgi:Tfp pilus assembly protein PilF
MNAPARPDTGQPWLSLCMIVKDEEMLLPQAIESVRDVVDEIVVVDTGSTDRSREIAASCGARVYEHAWDGRFGPARNAYLRWARGQWVLVLDGDEKIARRDALVLRRLTEDTGTAGYRLPVHNYTRSLDLLCDWHPNRGAYPDEEEFSQCPGYSRFRVVRLFRRAPHVRYEEGYSTHTNPSRSLRAAGGVMRDGDVVIHHFQYRKGGEAFIARKQLQRLANERHHLELYPDDAMAHLNVGRTLLLLQQDDEALWHLTRAVTLSDDPGPAFLSRAIARFETGQYAGAAADLEAAVGLFPEFFDAWAVLGIVYHALDRHTAATEAFARALALHPLHPVALNSFGVLLLDVGDTAGAVDYFRRALAVLPDYPTARANLASALERHSASSVDPANDQPLRVEIDDKREDV